MHQTTCSDDTYILALDSGTTSVRSILFDAHGTPYRFVPMERPKA